MALWNVICYQIQTVLQDI